MWHWFNCYLSGRHDYGMWCEPGAIFLRCMHCGRRSPGWTVEGRTTQPALPRATVQPAQKTAARVVPFNRATAS
jgi:hypothetical protein